MFHIADLFQWERFVTPAIIKPFYWLAVLLIVVFGISGAVSALATMNITPLPGLMMLGVSIFGTLIGIVFARIAAEFILVVFQINEHLGVIRSRAEI